MKTKDKNILMILVFVAFYLFQVLKKSGGDDELNDDDLIKQPDEKKEPYLNTKLKKGDTGIAVKKLQQRLNYIKQDIQHSAQLYNTGVITSIQSGQNEAWGNRMFFAIDDMMNNGGIDGKFQEFTRKALYSVMGKSSCSLAELRFKASGIKEMCYLPTINKMQPINNNISDNSDYTIIE